MTLNNPHYSALAPGFALVALAVVGTLIGCSESIAVHQLDAAGADSGTSDVSLRDSAVGEDAADDSDANPSIDAGVIADANVADVPEDVPEDVAFVRYERDVRPLLEASACGDCHAGVGVVMDYSWISAPGESWCSGEDYERRWNCFEVHARTQTAAMGQGCDSDFYHRHGEPCFMEDARSRVLEWAAGGYRE